MSEHWKNIIGKWLGNETDEEVDAFLNPPDAHEGTMSERVVGPLGHVMREFAAGNLGTQHLVGELAEAHKRLREYEGMMTRREVLEAALRYAEAERARGRTLWERVQWQDEHRDQPVLDDWTSASLICDDMNSEAAAHELALLMNAEREEAQGNE